MFGLAFKRLIITSMNNHVYSFKNEYRLQQDCGPTGLDETGEVADLYMLWWDLAFTTKLKDLKLVIDLYARFKDDCNIIGDSIPLGLVYDKVTKTLVTKSTSELGGDTSSENHTFNVLRCIADDVDEMISFTTDVPTNHSDGFLPVLDVKVQLNSKGKLLYQFYEKATKNNRVILASSALSWKQKRTILTQEALRRLRNTSLDMGIDVQNNHLTDLMLKLKDSGYSEQFRSEIVSSANKAFKIMIENHNKGIKPLHRNRKQMKDDKGAKLGSGSLWYNKGKTKYSSILFIPKTPNGIILKMMKDREAILNLNCSMKIKIVEKGGRKFNDLVFKKDHFKPKKRNVKLCPMCQKTKFTFEDKNDIGKCATANVGYKFICRLCNSTYEGETCLLYTSDAADE